MLAGMIVASSNNLADSIVYHHFGSFNNYKKAAMEYLRARGLKETVIGADASGLDAGTKSTARDLFELGRLALENEVVRELVARQSEDLLYTMEDVQTTNHSLARGYSGIKTGYTGEAGYCLLFSKEVEGKTVIGVVLGAGSDQARQDKADEFIKVLVGEGKSLPVAQPPNPARN
jgi:D-alanyl-D-alanine carboxypeptidase